MVKLFLELVHFGLFCLKTSLRVYLLSLTLLPFGSLGGGG
jgi:hypothetical protein